MDLHLTVAPITKATLEEMSRATLVPVSHLLDQIVRTAYLRYLEDMRIERKLRGHE